MTNTAAEERRAPVGVRSLGWLVAGWCLVALLGVAVVLYALAPIFQSRDQHKLLGSYANAVRQSSLESTGLYGYQPPTEPLGTGSPAGIIEIGPLKLQEVVVEGVGPGQTEEGPGHVPGTAGLGQPGNAAVVARHTAFGGPFAHLSALRRGQDIVVTTTEGQSLYVVRQVRSTEVMTGTGLSSALPTIGGSVSGPQAPPRIGSSIGVDDLYGPSTDNRLTLVTSSSSAPWNTSKATVVVAELKGLPFVATPQQSRSATEDGRSPTPGGTAILLLALLAYLVVAVGAVIIWRRSSLRTAYLVTTAPLIVVTILLAEAATRMLPAWA